MKICDQDRSIPGVRTILAFHKSLAERIIWPYTPEQGSLYQWRAHILAAIILAGMAFGFFAFIAGYAVVIKEGAWGLGLVNIFGVILGLVFICVRRIRFEIRVALSLFMFYVIGAAVIVSVGPLSGGPAWLFAFPVLAGVLLGNRAAIVAVIMNALLLAAVDWMISSGMIGQDFPFFTTPQTRIAAGINFLVVNAITAVSVSALLRGLDTSETRYRLMADNVADVIWTMDMDLNVTYISPSIFQMQGYTADEARGMPIRDLVTPDSMEKISQLYTRKMAQLESGQEEAWQPVILEAEQIRKDGSLIWTSINARLLSGPDGRPRGILGVTRDITIERKIQADKIAARKIAAEHEKLALVGRIAGKMAHDFNNVLGIIMGNAELARMDGTDPEMNDTLDLIVQQSERGKNLTKNLVAFAKSTDPRRETFSINEKIDFVLNLLKSDLEGILVETTYDEEITIRADAGMIEHVLVNLIQNAVHALSLTRSPRISIRAHRSEQHLVMTITDNGCGIPDTALERIFEPSFTLKGSRDVTGSYRAGIKGTGYGLSNVKKYLDLHNGRMDIHSAAGSGTAVTLVLPAAEKPVGAADRPTAGLPAVNAGKSILLVEDELPILDVQYSLLTRPPYRHRVDTAKDGLTAVSLIESSQYDLVCLDYFLPGHMNGREIYDHLRKKQTDVPVLFVSGNIEFLESIEDLKKKDPLIAHLSKPCRNSDYLRLINRLLEKNRP